MKRFILILQFMTRIPINIDVGFDEDFHKSLYYFPLVGFVLGVLSFTIGVVSIKLFDPFIVSIIITLSMILLTGGLHIDGVGDTFDALYSYRNKEKMLEIMKDSRLGTNSLLAIIFLILMKVGFIYSLINYNLLWIIIFMPVVSRLSVLLMTYKTVTPRKKGMGNLFIGKGTFDMIVIGTTYTIIFMILIGRFAFNESNIMIIKMATSIIPVFLFTYIFKKHVYKKIDGVTGDILGCTIEISELVYLIYMYLLVI
ncbi:MAG: adenosylcobinamide-GDP ribazoletransferase [Romboutsia sp.]